MGSTPLLRTFLKRGRIFPRERVGLSAGMSALRPPPPNLLHAAFSIDVNFHSKELDFSSFGSITPVSSRSGSEALDLILPSMPLTQ